MGAPRGRVGEGGKEERERERKGTIWISSGTRSGNGQEVRYLRRRVEDRGWERYSEREPEGHRGEGHGRNSRN